MDENLLQRFDARSNESDFAELDKIQSPDIFRIPQQESLPFTVGIVETQDQLARVRLLRQQAYGHHLPHLASSFGGIDDLDVRDDVVVFIAQDKLTGQVVGTVRLQTNRLRPLQVQQSVELPSRLREQVLAELTRLAVLPGYEPPVRQALVKAVRLWSIAFQINGTLACCRRALTRVYEQLGMSDLFGDNRLVPLQYAGGIPHRVMYGDQVTWEADSRNRRSPHHAFMFRTYHPDIRLFDSTIRSGLGARIGQLESLPRAA